MSAAAAAGGGKQSWICEACTTSNPGSGWCCSVCETARPGRGGIGFDPNAAVIYDPTTNKTAFGGAISGGGGSHAATSAKQPDAPAVKAVALPSMSDADAGAFWLRDVVRNEYALEHHLHRSVSALRPRSPRGLSAALQAGLIAAAAAADACSEQLRRTIWFAANRCDIKRGGTYTAASAQPAVSRSFAADVWCGLDRCCFAGALPYLYQVVASHLTAVASAPSGASDTKAPAVAAGAAPTAGASALSLAAANWITTTVQFTLAKLRTQLTIFVANSVPTRRKSIRLVFPNEERSLELPNRSYAGSSFRINITGSLPPGQYAFKIVHSGGATDASTAAVEAVGHPPVMTLDHLSPAVAIIAGPNESELAAYRETTTKQWGHSHYRTGFDTYADETLRALGLESLRCIGSVLLDRILRRPAMLEALEAVVPGPTQSQLASYQLHLMGTTGTGATTVSGGLAVLPVSGVADLVLSYLFRRLRPSVSTSAASAGASPEAEAWLHGHMKEDAGATTALVPAKYRTSSGAAGSSHPKSVHFRVLPPHHPTDGLSGHFVSLFDDGRAWSLEYGEFRGKGLTYSGRVATGCYTVHTGPVTPCLEHLQRCAPSKTESSWEAFDRTEQMAALRDGAKAGYITLDTVMIGLVSSNGLGWGHGGGWLTPDVAASQWLTKPAEPRVVSSDAGTANYNHVPGLGNTPPAIATATIVIPAPSPKPDSLFAQFFGAAGSAPFLPVPAQKAGHYDRQSGFPLVPSQLTTYRYLSELSPHTYRMDSAEPHAYDVHQIRLGRSKMPGYPQPGRMNAPASAPLTAAEAADLQYFDGALPFEPPLSSIESFVPLSVVMFVSHWNDFYALQIQA